VLSRSSLTICALMSAMGVILCSSQAGTASWLLGSAELARR